MFNSKYKYMSYFEAKVSYLKVHDISKEVSESYLVKADSLSEAEEIVLRECRAFGAVSEVTINNISKVKGYVVEPDNEAGYYYKARVSVVSLNNKTGKEVNKKYGYIVNAGSVSEALRSVDTYMEELMTSYRITSIVESPILNILRA